jgi:hypothetical protein
MEFDHNHHLLHRCLKTIFQGQVQEKFFTTSGDSNPKQIVDADIQKRPTCLVDLVLFQKMMEFEPLSRDKFASLAGSYLNLEF